MDVPTPERQRRRARDFGGDGSRRPRRRFVWSGVRPGRHSARGLMIAVVFAAVAFAVPAPGNIVATLMYLFGLIGFGLPRPWNLAIASTLTVVLLAWMALAASLGGAFLDAIRTVLRWFL